MVQATIGFFNEAAVGIDAGAVLLLGLLLPQPEDVLQPVQSHLNNLGVHHREQIAERLDAAQVDQVSTNTMYTCARLMVS